MVVNPKVPEYLRSKRGFANILAETTDAGLSWKVTKIVELHSKTGDGDVRDEKSESWCLENISFKANKRREATKWPVVNKPWDTAALNELTAQNKRNLIEFYLEDFINFAMARADLPEGSIRHRFREFGLIHKKPFELTPEFEVVVREELAKRGETVTDILPYIMKVQERRIKAANKLPRPEIPRSPRPERIHIPRSLILKRAISFIAKRFQDNMSLEENRKFVEENRELLLEMNEKGYDVVRDKFQNGAWRRLKSLGMLNRIELSVCAIQYLGLDVKTPKNAPTPVE
ncbi:MAG: hypothetical protein NTY03_08145 [Candidatus Bathyarchaeota archaeon]|nr:hypothetical protein [Candidatus Bathyarchaeota archaeon]